jgi:hypothetical protein
MSARASINSSKGSITIDYDFMINMAKARDAFGAVAASLQEAGIAFEATSWMIIIKPLKAVTLSENFRTAVLGSGGYFVGPNSKVLNKETPPLKQARFNSYP